MSSRLVLRPQALDEVTKTAEWYEQHRSGLGAEFVAAFEAAVESVHHHPFRYPEVHRRMRRALLRRFPYAVIYAVSDEEVVVLACMHGRRDPRRWRRRR